MGKKTAIVILNWNGKSLLEDFLPSVVKYSTFPGVEIVVADNASTDDSVLFLEKNYPAIKIVRLSENYGFAGGYNKALAQVDADYFVLLNSDVEVTENWLQPLIVLMDGDEKIAACQPKICSYRRHDYFEHAGAAGGFIDKNYFPFCRGRIFNDVEKDTGQYDDCREVFWATGAALMVRASIFKESGGLDNDFFAHMEEIDLCWRLKNRGYKIFVEPASRVYHLGGATLNYMSPRKTMLNFRNNLYMIYKNIPHGKFFGMLITRLFYDTVAAFKFLVSLQFAHFFAVIKAHWQFWFTMHRFSGKRKENLKQTIVFDHPEIYGKSVVKKFYLNGDKKFSELEF
ncbi:MAG: glycosyltransferase family 2 protein [Bacteroidales bacterium]|nr:glycosyltransferase family 2 protein [Bacteroidales bacterium]